MWCNRSVIRSGDAEIGFPPDRASERTLIVRFFDPVRTVLAQIAIWHDVAFR